MNRLLARLVFLAAGITLLCSPGPWLDPAAAQTDTGTICIATFTDANGNGLHDDTEPWLAGVNVSLAAEGVIIATHVTADNETGYCFETLSPGVYTLTFADSPTYRTTTPNEGTFALSAGQRLTINEFGAVPLPTESLRSRIAAEFKASEEADSLDTSQRLLLATAGSMLVMVFMIGVGAVIVGMISSRRRRQRSL